MRNVLTILFVSSLATVSSACPDLTGVWKGTCETSEGKTINRTLTISQNGCERITVNKKDFVTGVVRSVDNTFDGMKGISAETYMWDTSKTVLTHTKSAQLASASKSAILATTHAATLKLVGNKLSADSASRIFQINNGVVEEFGGTDTCLLSK